MSIRYLYSLRATKDDSLPKYGWARCEALRMVFGEA